MNIKQIIRLSKVLQKFEEVVTEDGLTLVTENGFEEGASIYLIDIEGNVTEADGVYTTEIGVITAENGIIKSIEKEEPEPTEPIEEVVEETASEDEPTEEEPVEDVVEDVVDEKDKKIAELEAKIAELEAKIAELEGEIEKKEEELSKPVVFSQKDTKKASKLLQTNLH